MKKCILLSLAGLLALAACNHPEPVAIPVERIQFEPASFKLFVGDQQEVFIKCFPQNATNLEELTISNSNTSVATFQDGLLTAKAEGYSQLTARCGDVSAAAKISVLSGWFTKESQKYGVEKASGYYYMFGNSSPQEMEIELTAYETDGDEQHFRAWIKCSNLGKTLNFLEDMDESQVSVWKNQNEDGYSIPYKKEDGTPAVVTADWSYTEAVVTKGLLTITDLSGGKYKVEADFALSNGYTFTANWEGNPSMQKEG